MTFILELEGRIDNMVRSVVSIALLSLLVCTCSKAQDSGCSPTDFHVEVTGTAFEALDVSVKNSFTDLLSRDLEATNATIIRLNSTVNACLASIKAAQSSCVQCINTTCQTRLDTLGCDNVVASTPTGGTCPLGRAVCDLQIAAFKVKIATTVATHAVENFGRNAVATIKNVAQVAINRATSALEAAGQAIKNTAGSAVSGVVNTANNIASDVERIVNNVGGDIVNGLRNAAEDAARGITNAANEVKDFFDNIGRRRRQAQSEPTCADFSSNTDACLYYSSQCTSCSAFNIGGPEPTAEDLVNGVCGGSDLADYQGLNAALARIDDIIEVYRNFTLYASRFNPITSTPTGKFRCVQSDFGLVVQNVSFYSADPANPYNPAEAGPQLAQDIFNLIFPNAA